MRIGLSGTNWTGKTSTIDAVVSSHQAGRMDVVSLSTLVGQCPYPMMEDQVLDGSRWMYSQVDRLLQKPLRSGIQLFDRTPIDILAFTQYVYDRDQQEVDSQLMGQLRALCDQFAVLFLLRPGDEWPVGIGPEPGKVAFARRIDHCLCQVIHDYDVEVVELPWDLNARRLAITDRLRGGEE